MSRTRRGVAVWCVLWQFDWRYVSPPDHGRGPSCIIPISPTEWRIGRFRRKMNEIRYRRNTKAIDALSELRGRSNISAPSRRGGPPPLRPVFDENATRRASVKKPTHLSRGSPPGRRSISLGSTRDHVDVRDSVFAVGGKNQGKGRFFVHGFTALMDPLYQPAEFHAGMVYREIKAGGSSTRGTCFAFCRRNLRFKDIPDARPLVVDVSNVRSTTVNF